MQVTSLLAGLESIEEPMINNERRDINHHLLEHELKLGKKTYSNTIIQVTSMGEIPNDDFLISKIKRSGVTNQLIGLSFLCNNAKYDEITKKIEGNGTDKALMEFAIRNIIGNLKKNYKIQAEIQFTSRNKWMMKTVKVLNHQLHNHFFGDELSENHSSLLLMKGAPEILFKKCKFYISKTGKKFNFTPETEKLIIKTQKKWSSQGQRVLIFIKKPLSTKEESELEKCQLLDLEKKINDIDDFEFVGMVGMIDPPREDIYDVMKQIKQAGIKVFMFTGDFYLTAAAIARKIGIFTTSQPDLLSNVRKMEEIVPEKYKSMDLISIKGSMRIENAEMFKLEIDPKLPVAKRKKRKPHELKIDEVNSLLLNGSDLDYLSPEDWMFVTKYDEIVFARTSPEQKLKVVTEFQKYGNIVGVTGDGVNDAPSLKKANIGIAMGSGSDAAKEVAELVLLDSKFSSILVAIQNGRLIFQNLRKMIIFSLPAGLFAEIMPVLLNIFLGVPQTMSSFQMIIVCIYTDLFPELAMIMEKPVFSNYL
jgi:sodium/potassium-transporting ATPase subunit alpha